MKGSALATAAAVLLVLAPAAYAAKRFYWTTTHATAAAKTIKVPYCRVYRPPGTARPAPVSL